MRRSCFCDRALRSRFSCSRMAVRRLPSSFYISLIYCFLRPAISSFSSLTYSSDRLRSSSSFLRYSASSPFLYSSYASTSLESSKPWKLSVLFFRLMFSLYYMSLSNSSCWILSASSVLMFWDSRSLPSIVSICCSSSWILFR